MCRPISHLAPSPELRLGRQNHRLPTQARAHNILCAAAISRRDAAMTNHSDFLSRFPEDRRLSRDEALSLVQLTDQTALMPPPRSVAMRRTARRYPIRARSSSRSRNCAATSATTAPSPARPGKANARICFLSEALAIAEAGRKAGCKEALFTLGDKPELRYGVARAELRELGHETTLSYLAEIAGLVLKETGLLPHVNPGLMSDDDLASLRSVSVSQGIMLESAIASPMRQRRAASRLAGQASRGAARHHQAGGRAALFPLPRAS